MTKHGMMLFFAEKGRNWNWSRLWFRQELELEQTMVQA